MKTTEPQRRRGRGGDAEGLNRITDAIIGAGMKVHRALGPGLLESAYEACLAYELAEAGFAVEAQKSLPLTYGKLIVPNAYRVDLVVRDEAGKSVIVEVKAVDDTHPVHEAQLLTYLKLTDTRVGLILNFNKPTLKDGLTRLVNGFPRE